MTRRIVPIHRSNLTPFCEGTVDISSVPPFYREMRENRTVRRNGRAPTQCQNRSSYVIGERHLCHSHAGREALRILMEEQS